jgi:putative membrane protein
MLRWILIKWLILAAAIGLTEVILPGIDIEGGFGSLLIVAAVFGVINAVLGPIARLLTFPLIALTLGLFCIIINTVLFLLTDWLLDRLDIDGFLPALGGAVIISIVVMLLEFIVQPIVGRE